MKRKSILIFVSGLLSAFSLFAPKQAAAGYFEFSLGFSYNKRQYFESSYTWTRRWGGSVAYNFTETSGLELSLQDVVDRTRIQGLEDTTFHDQLYTVNWVQALVGRDFPIQPYGKFGAGQLNRSGKGTYADGSSPPKIVDSITAVAAIGARVYLTKALALRTEVNSYLVGGSVRTWRDNVAVDFGLSFRF